MCAQACDVGHITKENIIINVKGKANEEARSARHPCSYTPRPLAHAPGCKAGRFAQPLQMQVPLRRRRRGRGPSEQQPSTLVDVRAVLLHPGELRTVALQFADVLLSGAGSKAKFET